MSASVQIDELILRIPGASAAEARALAEEVARQLARALAGSRGAPAAPGPARLELRVVAELGQPREKIAAAIAERILGGLR